MRVCLSRVKNSISLSQHPTGFVKFNVDRAASGKPGLVGIGGRLHNEKGEVLSMFSKHVVVNYSNEAGVLAI